jgi:DNA-directed RNA polymerase beta subunit
MDSNKTKTILKQYFNEQSFVNSSIESFNDFIENRLQQIIDENREIEPTIIPQNVDEFKIKLDKIEVHKPEIIEADGSKRAIYPIEARLRKISYSGPVYIEISSHINGVQRETFKTQICNMPIMLKSKLCHLNNFNKDELISKGEDPTDPGGYFIINGTERVVVNVEDLAANNFLIEKTTIGPSAYVGKLFSEQGSFKIPHVVEKLNDGILYLSFTRVKRIPLIIIIKALGLLKDEDIMHYISDKKQYDDILINLYEFVDIKTQEEAVDFVAKKIGITQSKEIRLERMYEILDKYLLTHVGTKKEDRLLKAYNLCKMIKKYIMVTNNELDIDDKDHYMNKRLRASGDLLADLFMVNLKVLISDILYNFQRIVKRGKFPSIKVIVRGKLLTQRISSSMATGNWVGGRKGVSQRISRINFIDSLSHLQRVVSPLAATQENFQARELHPTHLGRLCPIETPEGTNIGLRKNLSLLASLSRTSNEEKTIKTLKNLGLKMVK